MILSGRLWKEGKFWCIECPALDAMTQGKSKKDALEMMKDWVRSSLDNPSFEIDLSLHGNQGFRMRFEDHKPILELILERAKSSSNYTFDELARKMKKDSRSSVKTTMSVKHDPKLGTLAELFNAMGYDLEIRIHKNDDAA